MKKIVSFAFVFLFAITSSFAQMAGGDSVVNQNNKLTENTEKKVYDKYARFALCKSTSFDVFTIGVLFESGRYWHFNPKSKVMVGLNADFISLKFDVCYESIGGILKIGEKIGPCVAYNINSYSRVSTSLRLNPSIDFIALSSLYYYDISLALAPCINVNYHYKRLYTGLEYNLSRSGITFVDPTERKISLAYFNVSIGLIY